MHVSHILVIMLAPFGFSQVLLQNDFLHKLPAQQSELLPNNISYSSKFDPFSFSDSLQALRR